LQALNKTNPLAEKLSHSAKAILIFSNIIKAGSHLRQAAMAKASWRANGTVDGYYNSVGGSWGLQAGAPIVWLCRVLMNDKA